jgi:nucleoside-diphosphate-sugar epimerase
MTYSILLTGGMGYVGGRLADALIGEGYKVYCGTRRVEEISPSWLPGMQMVCVDWQSSDSLKNE